ncbi:MAG TPA: hypothetical protein VFK52_02920 [Nocardioidaceae bacterium]|nr:hypothetical protein [Nocardioidaceae bacterium]
MATQAPTATTTPPTGPTPKKEPPPPLRGPVEGADISWPQCPKGMGIPERQGEGQPMPKPSARFVVVGLTNGPAFHRNPCIESQLDWIRERGLAVAAYAVANYPSRKRLRQYGAAGPYDAGTPLGALGNTGYAQAEFNIETMLDAGLESPVVWVDVEPYPLFPWSDDVSANKAVVDGILRRYQEAGLKVGFYSAQGLWREVLGDTAYGLPEWRTAGRLSRADALERCGRSYAYQGGPAVISQWYTDHYDFDVTCPGTRLDEWFTG